MSRQQKNRKNRKWLLVLIGTFLFFVLIQLSLLITALFDTVKGLGDFFTI